MGEEPLVSIVIPCYKQAHLVGVAIQSVLDQTYSRTEILVVDDGSPDDVVTAVAKFGSRVTLVRQANGGLPSARNAGLRAATGEVVAFLDADDWILPDYVRRHLETRAQTGAAVTVCGWQLVDSKETVFEKRSGPKLDDAFHDLLSGGIAACHCFMLDMTIFAKVGLFDESLKSCEDWEMWLRVAAAGYKFGTVPDVLAAYVRSSGTMSGNVTRMYDSVFTVIDRWRGYHGRCDQCRAASQKALDFWSDVYFRAIVVSGLRGNHSPPKIISILSEAVKRTMRYPRAGRFFLKSIVKVLIRYRPDPPPRW